MDTKEEAEKGVELEVVQEKDEPSHDVKAEITVEKKKPPGDGGGCT